MKQKDLSKLAKSLIPDLPSSKIKGPMVVMCPAMSILRGLYFERSSDIKSFYVWVFLQPLFVPPTHLSFTFGNRLYNADGREQWSVDEPNLVAELRGIVQSKALPFLLENKSVANFVDAAMAFACKNPHVQEAIAYSTLKIGDLFRAYKEINNLLDQLDESIPWQYEMAKRAHLLKSLLEKPEQARGQLSMWEDETVKALGLTGLR